MQTSAFDDAFDSALDAMYSQFGVGATYTPSGGTAAAVTLMVDDRTRRSFDKTGSRSRLHMLIGSVRVSEVEALGRGDTLQLTDDDVVFKITPSSVSNDGLEWSFEATAEVTTTVGDVRTLPES